MLVTAVPKMENGAWSDSSSEEETETTAAEQEEDLPDKASNPYMNSLSDSMDLSGSISARNRRRDRLSVRRLS